MDYKLIKEEGGVAELEQSGEIVKFKSSVLVQNIAHNNKVKIEVTAQMGIEKAKMENLEHFNKFLGELTDEEKHATFLWFKSKEVTVFAKNKLKEIEVALENQMKAVKEIEDQTGFHVKLANEYTKEEINKLAEDAKIEEKTTPIEEKKQKKLKNKYGR